MTARPSARRLPLAAAAVALALAAAPAALAQTAAAPAAAPAEAAAGPVLELTGPAGASVRLDRAALEAMGPTEIVTRTPWGEGEHRFRGLPLAKLLERLGGRPREVEGVAINAYKATIRLDDPEARHAFVAFERDGQLMRIRDKGPFWIVFPWSQHPELDSAKVKMWAIWQLQQLRVTAGS